MNKLLLSMADALSAIADAARSAGSEDGAGVSVPATPLVDVTDCDELKAIAAFGGKIVVRLPDIAEKMGWSRERVMQLVRCGELVPLCDELKSGRALEFRAADVWGVVKAKKPGRDFNRVRPSLKFRRGELA